MFEVGSFRSRNCEGISRRAFLSAGAALPFAFAFPRMSATPAPAAGRDARAKSVMLIWLGGGPSHLDLFDPKPKAPARYRGPFSAISTRTPGLQVTELLPKLAERSDRYSVIRTNVNFNGGHRPAGSIAMTGTVATDGGEDRNGKPTGYGPHMGAVLARHRSSKGLPGFVSLATGPIGDGVGPNIGQGGGRWGKAHDPFMLSCSPGGTVSIPALKLLDGLSPARLSDRKTMLRELDRARRGIDSSPMQTWNSTYNKALDLLTSRAANRVFDLSRETEKTRQTYGASSFGQSCLLGRRLIEAGVPFVQVNWSRYVEVLFPFSDYGWDTHSDNFGLMADWHGPLLDRVLAALFDDLHDRGLLDSTLVLCMGEFGRTPKINNIASRDHWHHCYFSLWSGGGVKPGRVIGESDRQGEHPATDPVTPAMVATTVLQLAGVDAEARAEMRVLEEGRVIDRLL